MALTCFFPFAIFLALRAGQPPRSLEKKAKTPRKHGKSQKAKSKETQRSKERRIRVWCRFLRKLLANLLGRLQSADKFVRARAPKVEVLVQMRCSRTLIWKGPKGTLRTPCEFTLFGLSGCFPLFPLRVSSLDPSK